MDWVLVFLMIAFVISLILIVFFYFERGLTNTYRRMCSNSIPSPAVKRIFPLQERKSPWMNINPSISHFKHPGLEKDDTQVEVIPDRTRKAAFVVAYRLHRKEGFNWYWFSKVGISFMDPDLNVVDNFVLDEFPKGTERIYGYEDPRVFFSNGEICCLVTHSENNVYKMFLLKIDLEGRKIKETLKLTPDFEASSSHQKNWNPFFNENGKLLFVSRVQPHTIVDIDTSTGVVSRLHSTDCPLFHSPQFKDVKIHGGSCPIRLNENEYLGVCHLKYVSSMLLTYQSLLYTFEAKAPYAIKRVSSPFVLPSDYPDRIQMIFGLADFGDSVIMTAGIMDETMAGYVIKKSELMKLFPTEERTVKI